MQMETSIAVPDASGAFSALAGAMGDELRRHCYRMMGGLQDAEDCVQETLLRGWREFAGLRDPAAGRAWLYSIATRVCLDALRTRRRRQTLFGPSIDEIEPGTEPWVEPWPGGAERGQNIRLAFVSLLHGLSPQARAVLLLRDGVGMTAAETAAALGISVTATRSALQRARAALAAQQVVPPQSVAADDIPVEAYVEAWNAGDVGALIGLLQKDMVMTMPPWHRTFHGRDAVARFLTGVWPRYEGFRALATVANGQPAVALYTRRGGGAYLAHSLHVLAGRAQIDEIVLYAPPLGASLFAAFGLPPTA